MRQGLWYRCPFRLKRLSSCLEYTPEELHKGVEYAASGSVLAGPRRCRILLVHFIPYICPAYVTPVSCEAALRSFHHKESSCMCMYICDTMQGSEVFTLCIWKDYARPIGMLRGRRSPAKYCSMLKDTSNLVLDSTPTQPNVGTM